MKSQTNTGYVAFLSLVAAIGGILFGYDTAVISGTISGVASQFSLDAMQQGWFVGCALVGSIGGVAVAGVLSDRFGRKLTMLLSAVLFTVSAVGCAVSADFTQLVVYRIVGGVGIGVVSIVSPMYISEVAVARWRGTLVSLYQLAITVGFLAAYLVNFQILKSAETAAYASPWMQKIWVTELWRGMFRAETLPALLFFTVIFFIPESPRWLATKLQYGKAENILSHIGGKEYAKKEIESIKTVISATKEKLNIRLLFQGKIPGILLIGIVIAAFQQWCGLNVVFNYAQEIFEGMKAYRTADGSIQLFRPDKNMARMNVSCDRLCIPKIDEEFAIKAIKTLVEVDKDWVPSLDGTSLYISPYIFATDAQVGVHPAKHLTFAIILSPVGAYYPQGIAPVKIFVEQKYLRAVIGGTGFTKAGAKRSGRGR